MNYKINTLGSYISNSRKKIGMSQKELAKKIEREEGGSISSQYLNDIEHDRRSPSSDHIIHQLARVLNIGTDYIYYLAGRVPPDLRQANLPKHVIEKNYAALRKICSTKSL